MSLEAHEKKPPEAKLIYMANQIGKFFASQKDVAPPAGTAAHIKKFWDPRMRRLIVEHLDKGGAGLDPIAKQAIEIIKKEQQPAA